MSEIASERVGPMLNPPHLGELIRESMDEVGWNDERDGDAPRVRARNAAAPAERKAGRVGEHGAGAGGGIGWGTAEHWMRLQASYELAQARRDRAAAEHRAGLRFV